MKVRRFILDLFLAAIFGLAVGITLEEREIRKENERLNEEIFQTIWVKSANEIQPQNNIFNLGFENGNK